MAGAASPAAGASPDPLQTGMTSVMRAYEHELQSPLKNLVVGELARLLLIQVSTPACCRLARALLHSLVQHMCGTGQDRDGLGHASRTSHGMPWLVDGECVCVCVWEERAPVLCCSS